MGFGFDIGGGGILFLAFSVLAALFWGGLLVLIFLGIRWLLRQGSDDRRDAPPVEDTALALLRQRYARGEIDATEYDERRRTLGG